MKKFGFTLAEILITLTIIGVVASLTAPALVQNAANARTGPMVEKTRAAIELANQNILFQNRATDMLTVANGDNAGETYLQLLARNFQNSTFIPGNENADIGDIGAFSYTPKGSHDAVGGIIAWNGDHRINTFDGHPKLLLADGVVITPNYTDNDDWYNHYQDNNGWDVIGSYRGPLDSLLIDINGVHSGPNQLGRDLFVFTIDRSGVVIPDGSNFFDTYSDRQGRRWDSQGNNYQCDDQGVGTGRGCAGSILDNNRNVIYG